MVRGEESRLQGNQAVVTLNERMGTLTDTMRTSQQLMLRIAESQQALAPALHRLHDIQGGDDVARAHLRNIELYLQRLLAESEQGGRDYRGGAAQRSARADANGRGARGGAELMTIVERSCRAAVIARSKATKQSPA